MCGNEDRPTVGAPGGYRLWDREALPRQHLEKFELAEHVAGGVTTGGLNDESITSGAHLPGHP